VAEAGEDSVTAGAGDVGAAAAVGGTDAADAAAAE
jgi:hypothetical protein